MENRPEQDAGKWSIKEVIGHMADTEQIMVYRLLSIARGETESLPGFDENQYVLHAKFDHQTIQDILSHFQTVRQLTLSLIKNLNNEDWLKRGRANNTEVSVRALAYIIAGHELHHRQIILDRYLTSIN